MKKIKATNSNTFLSAIIDFTEHGSKIDGVYDLLLRGTGVKTKQLKKNWSDLDFSIVLNKIDQKSIQEVKNLAQLMRNKYDFKISITIVDMTDYFLPYHKHGIKPLFHTDQLINATSLLNKEKRKNILPSNLLKKYDSYCNIVYLIHDLRNKYMMINSENLKESIIFLSHCTKRSKHILRNALFIYSNSNEEILNENLLFKYFGNSGQTLAKKIFLIKNNWNQIIKENDREINKLSLFLLEKDERIFSQISKYINKVVK